MRLRRSAKHSPRSRMVLGVHVALVLVVAVVSAVVIGVVLWWLLGRPPLRQAGNWTTANSFEFAKIVLALIGGVGAVVALVIAYRKQHLGESAEEREDVKLFAERFTKASDQLGSDKAPVRLAGMYALEDLAQGTPSQRQTIVNVLCAYLRMPYDPPELSNVATKQAVESDGDAQPRISAGHADFEALEVLKQELQVRLTAQRILADHLRPGPTPRKPMTSYWGKPDADIDIDLTGATLIDFDLGDRRVGIGRFSGASFSGKAEFERTSFSGKAEFVGASFSGDAEFSGASFSGSAGFDEASFSRMAWFKGASFSGDAEFHGASFSGNAWFSGASFGGKTGFRRTSFIWHAGFSDASFSGDAWFSDASFNGDTWFDRASFSGDAWFSDASFNGDTWFEKASFNGDAVFSKVSFIRKALFEGVSFSKHAGFSEASFLDAWFEGASFIWHAGFSEASFSGVAWFERASFSRNAVFNEASFRQDAVFKEASFSGVAWFERASFSGNAVFNEASFSGNAKFAEATFNRPPVVDKARVLLDLLLSAERNWPKCVVVVEPDNEGESRLPSREGRWGYLETVRREGQSAAETLER